MGLFFAGRTKSAHCTPPPVPFEAMATSFLGVQLSVKQVKVASKVDTRVVAATVPKRKPVAKKPAAKSAPSKNKWTGSSSGYDSAKWYGADRKLFLPSGFLDPSEVPDYLDGTLAGDYGAHGRPQRRGCASPVAFNRNPYPRASSLSPPGYDPLGLGVDGNVEKYRAFELIHARWAMLGACASFPSALVRLTRRLKARWAPLCRRRSTPSAAATSRARFGGRCDPCSPGRDTGVSETGPPSRTPHRLAHAPAVPRREQPRQAARTRVCNCACPTEPLRASDWSSAAGCSERRR